MVIEVREKNHWKDEEADCTGPTRPSLSTEYRLGLCIGALRMLSWHLAEQDAENGWVLNAIQEIVDTAEGRLHAE